MTEQYKRGDFVVFNNQFGFPNMQKELEDYYGKYGIRVGDIGKVSRRKTNGWIRIKFNDTIVSMRQHDLIKYDDNVVTLNNNINDNVVTLNNNINDNLVKSNNNDKINDNVVKSNNNDKINDNVKDNDKVNVNVNINVNDNDKVNVNINVNEKLMISNYD